MNQPAAAPFSVLLWCSHPDLDNDALSQVFDFATADEAVAFYVAPPPLRAEIAFLEIDGLEAAELSSRGIPRVRGNPRFKPTRDERDDERRERAMQAGMAGGCAAYNEEMGWS
jgi:hypothetical protein